MKNIGRVPITKILSRNTNLPDSMLLPTPKETSIPSMPQSKWNVTFTEKGEELTLVEFTISYDDLEQL
jgi:hypothetical protein